MTQVADIVVAEAAQRARIATLVLTDFEDAARLRAVAPDAMAQAAGLHGEIVSSAVARHGGEWPTGVREADAVLAGFQSPSDAVDAALDIQREVGAHEWPEALGRSVRVAVHTGTANGHNGLDGAGTGAALRRCTRLCAVARGGQTVMSRATHDLVADRLPGGAELLDLGVHRLPDLGPPEHVYELAHPDLPENGRRLRSLDAVPNNLPRELTSFVGRERELEEVRGVLEGTRLLTLTGTGGCGKTRLALQTAADALGRFPDGIWFVELAPIADPELVGQALAAAIGVRPLPGQSTLGAAVSHLARRRALVVLDNCEHLLDAAAEAASALLLDCPEASVLATSRAPLALPGETTWRVPSLSFPRAATADAIDALAQSDAAQLLIERATKVRPDFTVTEETGPALLAVCSELDGIPLAIELAAARVRLLSVEQIAAGLSDRFHLLTGGDHTALARHRTLRASIDWSHELLSDEERALFRRLGVFTGGFTLEAVEDVTALDGAERLAVLDVLAALVDKSLVVAEEHGPAVRYRLLETVREYALERLAEAGELEEVRDRHLSFFLALAERAEPELVTVRYRTWMEALDADGANLAAALERANAREWERALRLCAALTIWWKLRGMFAEADAGCARALAASDPAPSALRARVLWGRSYLLTFAARYVDAFELGQAAHDLAEDVGDASTMARALFVHGTIRYGSDPLGARPLFERSRELARESGDDWCLAAATAGAGWSHVVTDDYDEADRLFQQCLPIVEGMGYQEFVAWALFGMAFRHGIEGDFERFFELSNRAVDAARDVGEPVSESSAQSYMARVEMAQGRTEQALERVEATREHVVATGAGFALPQADLTLAVVRAAHGDLDSARAGLQAVVTSGADFGWILSWTLLELAALLRAEGDLAGAEEHARRGLEITEQVGNRMRRAWAKEILGRVAAERGELSEAEALLHESLAPRAELNMRFWQPQTLDALAEVAARRGSHEEATRLLAAAGRARSDLGLVRWAPDEPGFEALERDLRAELGPEAFAAAWHEGAGLTMDEAVAWARRGRGARKRPRTGWESLTPTELEVTRHAAAGLTNVEIGELMFISRGTVKSHLSRIYAKLAVRNRAELTAAAAQRLPAADG